jgi:hypothetical protein
MLTLTPREIERRVSVHTFAANSLYPELAPLTLARHGRDDGDRAPP